MTDSGIVENERVARIHNPKRPHVGEGMPQGRTDIIDERACRADGVALSVESESVQRENLEVARQIVVCGLSRKRPALNPGRVREKFAARRKILLVGNDQFSRAVTLQRLIKFLDGFQRLDAELARRKIENRNRKPRHGGDVIVYRLVEKPVFSNGSGRDDARDFAADEPLRRLGIFNLIAQGGRFSRPDKFSEIRVQRVMRHTAHLLGTTTGKRRA